MKGGAAREWACGERGHGHCQGRRFTEKASKCPQSSLLTSHVLLTEAKQGEAGLENGGPDGVDTAGQQLSCPHPELAQRKELRPPGTWSIDPRRGPARPRVLWGESGCTMAWWAAVGSSPKDAQATQ